MAPRRVPSDQVSSAVGGRRITAAVCSTLSFDPAFFELEILPLLFKGRVRSGISHLENVRRVQLEECLRDAVETEVFYARSGLAGNAGSASLDSRRIDVGRKTGGLRPQLVLVLVENPASRNGVELHPRLVVAALPANLTRSRWWENIGTGHVEVIEAESSTNLRCTFRHDLLCALERVMDFAGPEERGGALRTIYRFVRDTTPKHGAHIGSRLGRFNTRLYAGQASFSDWLRRLRIADREWNLEVVSPFLDAYGAQALSHVIRTAKPSEVRVLMPSEADGSPVVTGEQFDAVADLAKWSRFRSAIKGSPRRARSEEDAPRRMPAKVYRFWRRGKGDTSVVGTVNLTGAAHSPASAGNLEAAFQVNTRYGADRSELWLKPLDEQPKRFREESADEEGSSEPAELALSLRSNWQRHAFEYRLDDRHDGDMRLRSIAGEELHTIAEPVQGDWTDGGSCAADQVKNLLVSTSLAEARISIPRGPRGWRLLIREQGMTQQPSLIAQFAPEEILQYWSLLVAVRSGGEQGGGRIARESGQRTVLDTGGHWTHGRCLWHTTVMPADGLDVVGRQAGAEAGLQLAAGACRQCEALLGEVQSLRSEKLRPEGALERVQEDFKHGAAKVDRLEAHNRKPERMLLRRKIEYYDAMSRSSGTPKPNRCSRGVRENMHDAQSPASNSSPVPTGQGSCRHPGRPGDGPRESA